MINIWECPHGRQFMDELGDVLRAGDRHVITHLPMFRVAGFADAFSAWCRKYLGSLAVIQAAPDDDPYLLLREQFRAGANASITELISLAGRREYLLLLAPGDLGENQNARWMEFFRDLGLASKQACLDAGLPLPWRIHAIVPTNVFSPKPDVALEIFMPSGLFRASDLEYTVERNLLDNEYGVTFSESSRLWLYALCIGLGASDPEMCNAIFQALPMNAADVDKLLSEYRLTHVTDRMIKAIIRLDDFKNKNEIHRDDYTLLQDFGLLDYDIEDKARLHPAALWAAKRMDSVWRLITRGQIRVYLPLVYEAQNFIVARLRALCGNDWHKRDAANSFQTVATDIGPLYSYIRRYLMNSCPRELMELACIWREVRHTLAHGNMLDFATARQAVSLYGQLRDAEWQ